MDAPRRSSRRKKTNDTPPSKPEHDPRVSRKRRRTTSRAARAPDRADASSNASSYADNELILDTKKLGGVEALGEATRAIYQLPMDVWYEVFAYLSPLDPLHFSRTTKPIRSVLLNRNCRAVWTRALRTPWLEASKPAPPCPADLAEPAYAALVLEYSCYYCDEEDEDCKIIAELRTRCCPDCFRRKKNFVPLESLRVSLGHKYAQIAVELLIPVFSPIPGDHMYRQLHFVASDVKLVMAGVRKHSGRPAAMAAFRAERAALLAPFSARANDGAIYARWSEGLDMAKNQARDSRRADASPERLSNAARGFFDFHPFVFETEPLTDHAWTQLREEFVELIARLSVLAPAQKRIYALEAAFSRHTPHRPPLDPNATPAGALADLFTRADARALVSAPAVGPDEDDGDDAAISEIVRAHDRTRTYKGYPKLRNKRFDVLRPLLPPGLVATVDDGKDFLPVTGLVTCLFCCTRCELVLTPWDATAHHCDLGTLDDADELWLTYGCLADRFAPLALPWNYGGCLAYDADASRAAVAVISALELDADKLRAIYKHAAFACGAEHCRRVRMFSWLDAVTHHQRTGHEIRKTTYKIFDNRISD